MLMGSLMTLDDMLATSSETRACVCVHASMLQQHISAMQLLCREFDHIQYTEMRFICRCPTCAVVKVGGRIVNSDQTDFLVHFFTRQERM